MKRTIFPVLMMFALVACLAATAHGQRDPYVKFLSKKPKIKEVEVEGNTFFSDDKISGAIRSKANGFWQSLRLAKVHRLRKDSERIDIAAVSYLYRSAGFNDVKIEETFRAADDDSSAAIVRIEIDEGLRYLIRNATSPSDLGAFSDRVNGQIRRLKTGDPLNPYKIEQVIFDIKTEYANRGYPYAKVSDSIVLVPETDSVDVLIPIDRGPLTVFGDLVLDSLKYTRPHTFTRELVFDPGDLYSRQKIIDSRQRVYSTGLANYVNLSVIDPAEEELVDGYDVSPDFKLRVLERKPRFAKIKTGAGQDKEEDLVWDLSLEVGSRNISGRGRHVSLELFSSFLLFAEEGNLHRVLKERFAFDYTEPWLFKIRMPLNFRFAVEPGIRSKTQRYRISRLNLGLSTARDLSHVSRISGGIEWEKINITGIPIEQLDELKEEEGISVKRKLLFSFERDTRNNLLLPIRGSYYRFDSEYVGGFLGGDNSFIRIQGSVSKFQNFYGSNIYAWNYRFGWAEGTGSDPYVPSVDRFYLGGAKTIRGYPANQVTPHDDDGNLTGGLVMFHSNQELRRPLVWKLWCSAFIDAGGNYEDFEFIRLENLLVSGGVGLQYISPVGPVRVDYGHRLIHPGFGPGGRFHLSILYAF
jgi:outer membrane protein insertion porin family